MRDHGLLWARVWDVVRHAPDHIQTRFTDANLTFARSLALLADGVAADYCVTNAGSQPMPYLCSQHCLLATTPADAIRLSGQSPMTAEG